MYLQSPLLLVPCGLGGVTHQGLDFRHLKCGHMPQFGPIPSSWTFLCVVLRMGLRVGRFRGSTL